MSQNERIRHRELERRMVREALARAPQMDPQEQRIFDAGREAEARAVAAAEAYALRQACFREGGGRELAGFGIDAASGSGTRKVG